MNANNVVELLKTFADSEKAAHSKRFFKAGAGGYGEGDLFLGIKVPDERKVAKKYRELPLPEVEKLLQNPFHEIRLTAALLLVYKVEKGDYQTLEAVTAVYLRNLAAINNWDLVDSSCPAILGRFLEYKERDLLYDFAESENLWRRRIAIITCFYFIKKNDFYDALEISEILLNDNHDLIHKAVGWMLREIGNRSFATEEAFLKKHYQKMPRTMLRYAIEKFNEPLRQRYLRGEITG